MMWHNYEDLGNRFLGSHPLATICVGSAMKPSIDRLVGQLHSLQKRHVIRGPRLCGLKRAIFALKKRQKEK